MGRRLMGGVGWKEGENVEKTHDCAHYTHARTCTRIHAHTDALFTETVLARMTVHKEITRNRS